MILHDYLRREVGKPLIAIIGLLIVIFASHSAAQYLSDAVDGLLPPHLVMQLIGLKLLITLETLLPVALYLAGVMGLGRLYSDTEMTALYACGMSEGHVVWALLRLAILCACLVGLLALYVRPWAYQQSYRLQVQVATEIDLSKLHAERFYDNPQARRTLFAERIDYEQRRMEKVFVRYVYDTFIQVIYADYAYQPPRSLGQRPQLIFQQGYLYDLVPPGEPDRRVRFNELTVIFDEPIRAIGYRRKAASLDHLWNSSQLKDQAELHWRMSRPLATVLLGLLSIPLSRTAPRQGRYGRLVIAILAYALYYNLSATAKVWVERGWMTPFPGIWIAEGLLAVTFLVLLLWPTWQRHGYLVVSR